MRADSVNDNDKQQQQKVSEKKIVKLNEVFAIAVHTL